MCEFLTKEVGKSLNTACVAMVWAGLVMLLTFLSDFFFKNSFFKKQYLSRKISECQTAWNQIRTDVLSVLIWVQTVCKGYQQTTKVAACRQIVMHCVSNREEWDTMQIQTKCRMFVKAQTKIS